MPPRAASLICALALTSIAIPAAAGQWTKTYPLTGRPSIEVVAGDAAVTVTTSDRKDVEVTLTTHGWTIGDRGVSVGVETAGNQLRCRLRQPHVSLRFGGSESQSIELDIAIPRDADLDVRAGDGGVTVGPVNGSVRVRTSDGSIDAHGLHGETSLQTGNGSIQANGLDGGLAVITSEGRIGAEGRFERLDVRTGGGRVDIAVLEGSKLAADWHVKSGNGAVSLHVPSDLRASLDLTSNTGTIHVGLPLVTSGDFRRARVAGNVNGGGPVLSVHSSVGSIRIDPL